MIIGQKRHSVISLIQKAKDAVAKKRKRATEKMDFFRVRECNFSLG